MLVTENKAEFSLQETLIILLKSRSWGMAFKGLSLHHEKHYARLCVHLFGHYYFLWSTWHVMFSHTKFQIGINISHVTFLQCVWIKPNLFSLRDVENLTSNFGQSDQICQTLSYKVIKCLLISAFGNTQEIWSKHDIAILNLYVDQMQLSSWMNGKMCWKNFVKVNYFISWLIQLTGMFWKSSIIF